MFFHYQIIDCLEISFTYFLSQSDYQKDYTNSGNNNVCITILFIIFTSRTSYHVKCNIVSRLLCDPLCLQKLLICLRCQTLTLFSWWCQNFPDCWFCHFTSHFLLFLLFVLNQNLSLQYQSKIYLLTFYPNNAKNLHVVLLKAKQKGVLHKEWRMKSICRTDYIQHKINTNRNTRTLKFTLNMSQFKGNNTGSRNWIWSTVYLKEIHRILLFCQYTHFIKLSTKKLKRLLREKNLGQSAGITCVETSHIILCHTYCADFLFKDIHYL